jgi:hypothetical protein
MRPEDSGGDKAQPILALVRAQPKILDILEVFFSTKGNL